jgi:hypothetical protein
MKLGIFPPYFSHSPSKKSNIVHNSVFSMLNPRMSWTGRFFACLRCEN